MMRRTDTLRAVARAVGAAAWLVLAGCSDHDAEREASREPDAAPIVVRVAPATAVERIPIDIPADIEAAHSATLASRISAVVRSVTVNEGDRVRAGQVVVTLDARDVEARAAAAEAALRAAEAHHRRVKSLLQKDAATRQEMEAAEADLESARAGLGAARAQLDYVRLSAPFAARVTARHVDAGDLAVPGQPLVALQADGALQAVARVTASQAELLAIGAGVEVGLDDGSAARARVSALSPAGEPASRRFLVKADLEEGSTARAGSFARLRLMVPSTGAVVAAPREALFERGALTGLFVAEEGRARLRWVSVGEELPGGLVIVKAGLSTAELVALEPGRLVDGAPIRPAPAASQASP